MLQTLLSPEKSLFFFLKCEQSLTMFSAALPVATPSLYSDQFIVSFLPAGQCILLRCARLPGALSSHRHSSPPAAPRISLHVRTETKHMGVVSLSVPSLMLLQPKAPAGGGGRGGRRLQRAGPGQSVSEQGSHGLTTAESQ